MPDEAAATAPDSPWPEDGDTPVLFVLDARHAVESDHLQQWIAQTRPEDANAPDRVPLSLEDYRANLSDLTQKLDSASAETRVVPLRMVWLPQRDGRDSRPRIRDLVLGDPRLPTERRARRLLRKQPDSVQTIAGEAATVADLRQRFENLAEPTTPGDDAFAGFVARQAALALDLAERRLRGNRYKVPRFVAETLQSRPAFQDELAALAEETGQTLETVREKAAEYLKEMVATPNTFFIDMMGMTSRFMANLGYEKDIVCDPAQLERVRQQMLEYPSAVLWSHKSYVDGSAVMSLLYDHDFPSQHSMGGINMNFAGIGYLSRRSGVIFIRRSFQDNPVYKMVLRQYLGFLMEKRFPFSWSFEGTRSRTGKLMPPRLGILKYVMEAAEATGARNLHLIPVSVSYDLISDVADYASEQTGATKKPETLRWFVDYLKGLKQPMGRIYLNFAEAVVVENPVVPDDTTTLPKLAFEVAQRVNQVTPISLPSLVCTVLLGAAPQALTLDELGRETRALVRWATLRLIALTDDFDPRDLRVANLAQIMIDRGLITRYDEGPDEVYGIHPDQHAEASYYRNTTIHHFVIKALAELAVVRASEAGADSAVEVFRQETRELRDLFKFEFFFPPSDEYAHQVTEELAAAYADWSERLEQGGESAFDLLRQMDLLIAHATLLHFVEAYTVVADLLARQGPQALAEQATCVNLALKFGRQAYLQRRISSEASIGKQLFSNAWQTASHRGLLDPDTPDERRDEFARNLRALMKRVRRIRTLAAERRGIDNET